MDCSINKLNAERVLFRYLRDSKLNPDNLNLNEVIDCVMQMVYDVIKDSALSSEKDLFLFRLYDESTYLLKSKIKYGSPCSVSLEDESLRFLKYVIHLLIAKDERLKNYIYHDLLDLVSSLHTGTCVSLLSNVRALRSSRDALELIKSKGKMPKDSYCLGVMTRISLKSVAYTVDNVPDKGVLYNGRKYDLREGVLSETKVLILKNSRISGCTENYSADDDDFGVFEVDEELLSVLDFNADLNLAEETNPALTAHSVSVSLDDLIESKKIPVGERDQKNSDTRGDGIR